MYLNAWKYATWKCWLPWWDSMVSDSHSRTSDKCHDGANVCFLFTEPLVSTCKTHLYMIRTNDKIQLIVSRQTCPMGFSAYPAFMRSKSGRLSHAGCADKTTIWARRFRETDDFKTFNNFETYFLVWRCLILNMAHLLKRKFACQDAITFSFNIYPQLFLQEIAILFIYYLFSWFIRFNRLWKWKAFYTVWHFPFFSVVPTLEMSCR